MKRVGGLFETIISFSCLRQAARLAKRGVKPNREMAAFLCEQESQLLLLHDELRSDRYQPRPFRAFRIKDPKPRLIQAAHFRDRVVHHAICLVIAPLLERSYLAHSFACQRGKGCHQAVLQAQAHTRRHRFFIKFDILHFFENLNHHVLFKLLQRRIKDMRCLQLIQKVINHGGTAGKGVPIGNLTSQHFANFYLDYLDHFIIEQHKVDGYIRYMDDILFFGKDLMVLQGIFQCIDDFVADELRLQIKERVTRMGKTEAGVPFLGFRVYPHHIRFDAGRKRRFVHKWRQLEAAKRAGACEEQVALRFNSMFAWAEHANTLHLRQGLIQQPWLGDG